MPSIVLCVCGSELLKEESQLPGAPSAREFKKLLVFLLFWFLFCYFLIRAFLYMSTVCDSKGARAPKGEKKSLAPTVVIAPLEPHRHSRSW